MFVAKGTSSRLGLLSLALLAALTVSACADRGMSPVGPEESAALARGGVGVGGGSGGGQTGAPGQKDGGGKENAPGKNKDGDGGGGGGGTTCGALCSSYTIDLSGVCFGGSGLCEGGSFSVQFTVGVDDAPNNAAPCPVSTDLIGATAGTNSWTRFSDFGDIRCKLEGITRTASSTSLSVQLPDDYGDGFREKGDLQIVFSGTRPGISQGTHDALAEYSLCDADSPENCEPLEYCPGFGDPCYTLPGAQWDFQDSSTVLAFDSSPVKLLEGGTLKILKVLFFVEPKEPQDG